jgi:hypothetical protein
MGHEVVDYAFPGNQPHDVDRIRAEAPSIDRLNSSDLILSTYHEYIVFWLAAIYRDEWKKIKVPIVARFDESMDRDDLGLPTRMPELKKWATHFSFPAAQDAEKFGGEWHPFGADTLIFNPTFPADCPTCGEHQPKYWRDAPEKKYSLAFIGTMYPQRQAYLQKLANVGAGLTFHVGNAIVQDLSGIRERESVELLAENYRAIKIFFCLPPISRLLVEKIFDVMACDTLVMYPRLYGDAEKNLSIFEHEKHLVYYDIGYFANNVKQVRFFLDHPEEREKIARAGGELVRSKYTLEHLLDGLLAMPGKVDGRDAALPDREEVPHGQV